MKERNEGFRRAAAALATTLLLAGCVVGPDYQTPDIEVPKKWSASGPGVAKGSVQLFRWWEHLHDPVLNQLIEQAVAGNLDVRTAKAAIREARASYAGTVGGVFPSVSGSGSLTESKSGDGNSSGMFQAGFDASWEIDLFGARRREIEASTRGVEVATEELRATLLTLIGDVAAYYIEARGYQARIALAKRTADSQQETKKLTQAKYEAGASSRVDVAKATADTASTFANIADYVEGYRKSVHRLGVLLGREPSALVSLLDSREGVVPQPPSPLPAGIPADVLRSRPDVRAAERQLAQATAKIGQAEADRYPSISLTGDIATSGTSIGDLARNSSISWSIGPSISIPVFDGGSRKANVVVAQAQRDQYYLAYRAAVLTALEDVENALVSLSQSRIKNRFLREATENYREAAKLSRSLYKGGSSSFLDVLDAERSLYSSEDSLLQNRITIATTYVALLKALGGGWSGEVDSSQPEIIDVQMRPRPTTRHTNHFTQKTADIR